MTSLPILFVLCLLLAWQSEKTTRMCQERHIQYSTRRDWAYVLLVILLILFSGLRTAYNDTTSYRSAYIKAPVLSEFLADPLNLNLFRNPLFYGLQSFFRTLTPDPQPMFFFFSVLVQLCFIGFLKRYSRHFTFSIFLYFTLGTFAFTLAALKQVVAMSILIMALPFLEERKFIRFYLLVFVAMLLHTYAVAFALMPLLAMRPWRSFTFLLIGVSAIVLMNFTEVITEFMEQADELGKILSEDEIFDDHTVNLFRLGVYAVVPLLSFLFRRWVCHDNDKMENTLLHMSIVSLACMAMGTQSGANMFGRMAAYFEIGTLCCLPWMLDKIFEHRSVRLIRMVAVGCFLFYFIYANWINASFEEQYSAISLLSFLRGLAP